MSKKAFYKNVRKEHFTQISNDMLWNSELTLQAKGLLSIFLSNSNDWETNMKEIIKRSKNGRDAHYGVVNELIEKGYFARIETRGKEGFENMQYIFSDNPVDIEEELTNIENSIPENKQVFIEYKNRADKSKKDTRKESKVLDIEVDNAVNSLLTENQDAGKNVLTGNQDAENQYAENQYINNTNSNNTNFNNTKSNEEEEKIKNARANNIVYDILHDFLTDKGLDHKTANNTIKLMINKNIDLCSMTDIEKQFTHMMNKLTYEEVDNHNNFAAYFVNGLEMRIYQSKANKKHQREQLAEFERIKQEREERDTSFYYNWLEDV